MQKQPLHGGSRFRRFINSNGFYAVLGACLLTALAVGGVAVAGFSGTEPTESKIPAADPAQRIVTGENDDRTTTTTVTTTASTATTTVSTTAATSATTAKAAPLYVFPMGNTMQEAYSDGKPAYSVTMESWQIHNGTDFAAKTGSTVKALADGTVKSVSTDPLWGEILTVEHGKDILARYCGVHAAVGVGQTVKVGDPLGTLTEIPCESAQEPHLHLEIFVKDLPTDPVKFIGRETRTEHK